MILVICTYLKVTRRIRETKAYDEYNMYITKSTLMLKYNVPLNK